MRDLERRVAANNQKDTSFLSFLRIDEQAHYMFSEEKRVVVGNYNRETMIHFRMYVERDDGGYAPTKKGVTLNTNQWNLFVASIDAINRDVIKA